MMTLEKGLTTMTPTTDPMKIPVPTPEQLPDGRYTLTEDVVNPHGDGRKKYDWRAFKVWKKGMTFLVRRWKDGTVVLEGPRQQWLEIEGAWCGQIASTLITKLVKTPETAASILRLGGHASSADEVLQALLDLGHITPAHISAAMQKLDADYDAEEKAAEQKA